MTQTGTDAPICQDIGSGGLGEVLARAEVCHDALVDLAGEEAFEAPDDLAFGPAISGAACDVVAGRLVKSHPDDDGSIEGGVGLSMAAPIEPAGDTHSSSSSPTPCSAGIDAGFGSTGAGRVGRVGPGGPASRAPFKRSSARCAAPIRPGAPRASTASC